MQLKDLLTADEILLGFQAPDKWQAIERMAATLGRSGRLAAALAPTAREALLLRERSMTTGMEHGVAIPHAALDHLPELLAVLAIAPDGIPFEAIYGQPGRILVLLLIPRRDKLLHIRTLAGIARLLADADVRHRLLESATADEVLAAIGAE